MTILEAAKNMYKEEFAECKWLYVNGEYISSEYVACFGKDDSFPVSPDFSTLI